MALTTVVLACANAMAGLEVEHDRGELLTAGIGGLALLGVHVGLLPPAGIRHLLAPWLRGGAPLLLIIAAMAGASVLGEHGATTALAALAGSQALWWISRLRRAVFERPPMR